MRLYRAALAALLTPLATSVFVDEAYKVDFHYALLGQPQQSSTFFHQPVKTSKASLLYTVSEKSVLGAVNPKDGAILWRHVLSSNQSSVDTFATTGEGHDTIITASGSQIRSWNAADGKLAWETEFGSSLVQSLAVEPNPGQDVFALVLEGKTVQVHKIDGLSGSIKWTYKDTSGDSPYRLAVSSGVVYLTSFHSTMLKGFKLRVTALDPQSGKNTDQHTLSSDGEISKPEDVVFMGSVANSAIAVWSESGKKTIKLNMLGTKDIQSFDTGAGGAQVESISAQAAVHSNAPHHLLVHFQTKEAHWAEVFEIDRKKNNVRKVTTYPKVAGKGAFSGNMVEGTLYFTRITEDEMLLFSSASSAVLASWPIDFAFNGYSDKLKPLHATSELVVRPGPAYAVRSAVLLSSGDWALVRNGEVSWWRPESLSGVVKAEWEDFSTDEKLAEELKIESSTNLISSFIHRSRRHIDSLQNLPAWFLSLLSGPPILMAQSGGLTSSAHSELDAFGFHKILIATTDNGRRIALDVGDRGRIIWNKPIAESNEPQDNDKTRQSLQNSRDDGLVRYSMRNGVLHGHEGEEKKTLWSFKPHPDYRITSVTPQLKHEPIASIGRVLGDRRVLYKYLNPNAVLVIAVSDRRSEAVATLLDAVSGNVLYTSKHESVDTSRPIASAISENWMSFSYTVDAALESVSKGFQLVFAEFYESDQPNDRGLYDIASNYSAVLGGSPASKPFVMSTSFHVPEEITKMAVTQTAQGITSRQLLVGLSGSNSIVAIPTYALDPRRIVGKDPTSDEMQEGLSKYSPMIDFDPKWYLNHQEEIFGVREILTIPSSLESTSIVVAFGLDLFGTRVSPSFAFDVLGGTFNKIQLVLTVLALLIGVFIVAPLIERKQTNTLWQSV